MRTTVCDIFLNGLEDFTGNPEDTEVLAPALISQDSDSERPAKVVSKSRKHSIHTHLPKDRNCEVCLRTQMTRAPTLAKLDFEQKSFGDFITTDHKVFNEEGES